MTSAKQKVFTRDATGLIRELSVFDSFGVAFTGVGVISIFLFFSSFMTAAPTDNPLLSVVLMIIPLMALAAAWAYLMAVFPRSGGDYVYNTRAVNPALGVMTDFLYVSILPSVLSVFAIIAIQTFADMFMIESFLTGSSSLSAIATSLAGLNQQFILVTVLTVITAFFLVGRTKIYARFQAFFVLAGIVAVVGLVVAMAVTSNSAYQTLFNQVFHVDYNTVLKTAASKGFTSPSLTGLSLYGTSFLVFWMAGPEYAAFVAGETKQPQKTGLISIIGAQAIVAILFVIVGLAAFSTFGVNFSYSVNYLVGQGANPLPTTQVTFLDLAVPLMGNPLVVGIVFTVIGVGAYLVGSNAVLAASRKIFAWAFDRLLPAKFADVSPRFGTPIYSSILVSVIAEIFNYLIIYNVGIYNIVAGFSTVYSTVIWGLSGLAAILLPFRKQLFDQAPAFVRKKIGSVPVMSIIGGIAFFSIVGLLIFGQVIPSVQGTGVDPRPIIWTFGIFFGGLVYYYIVKAIRMRQGIDMSLVYRQIPPE
jgi:amino acid transporter